MNTFRLLICLTMTVTVGSSTKRLAASVTRSRKLRPASARPPGCRSGAAA